MGVRYIGAEVKRLEDPKLIIGRGHYVDDIHLSGMLEVAFVRSSHAHAKISGIDVTAAAAMPGVIAVYTAADFGDSMRSRMPQSSVAPVIKQPITQYPLAADEVCYVGETIAVVVAERRSLAEDAAAVVAVEYEPLSAMAEFRKALDADAAKAHAAAPDNLVATIRAQFGDVETVFAGAPHVFRETFAQHRGGCHAMECRGIVATFDPIFDQMTVWTSTQAPYLVRRLLAGYLGRDESAIRVAAPDVGGGFGPKAGFYAEEIVLALLAERLRRPVKWIEDRREHFYATTQQRDQFWDVEVAANTDGRILGLRGRCIHDNGAYVPYGVVLPATSLAAFPGPYALACLDIRMDAVFTNMVPSTPVRGAGRPNTAFVLERMADRVARELKIDRAEIRRRSFVRPDQFPYETGMKAQDGSPVSYDSGSYHACLDRIMEKVGANFVERQRIARAEGRYLGLGIASYVEDTGLAPFEGVSVRVLPSGYVVLRTGAASQGQGHATVLAQICAEGLGVPIERIKVEAADTGKFALGIATVASRVAVTAGSSAQIAAERVRAKALKAASNMLEAAEQDLVIEDGVVHVAGVPAMKVTLAEIAQRLAGTPGRPMPAGIEPDLAATAYFDARKTPFANGTNAAEVEVDIETGEVKILRYLVVHDCGRLLNPRLVEGQIVGGVVHGIGNALYERMIYDESGQPLTTNYGEYLLPLATEMPQIEVEHIETPSPLNPLGVKGAGEGGTIPAIATIISAIEDALAPFGVRIEEYPLGPERLLDLIDSAKAKTL